MVESGQLGISSLWCEDLGVRQARCKSGPLQASDCHPPPLVADTVFAGPAMVLSTPLQTPLHTTPPTGMLTQGPCPKVSIQRPPHNTALTPYSLSSEFVLVTLLMSPGVSKHIPLHAHYSQGTLSPPRIWPS